MFASKEYVFVLWGNGFDEAAAAIFITELREAGLLVRVVGLTARQTYGARGLALIPDITLDEALSLAPQVICLIIPSKSRWIEQYKYDPRIRRVLELAISNHARFVIGKPGDAAQASLKLSAAVTKNVVEYPAIENLVYFAREIVGLLPG